MHLRQSDIRKYVLKRPKSHLYYRLGYQLAAWLTPVLVIIAILCFILFSSIEPPPWIYYPIWFAVVAIFIKCRQMSKRYAIDTEQAIASDERAPILYLRSFRHDAIGRIFNRGATKITELRLTSVLKKLGPVIAIGQPGEELPPLGALRLYFPNEEWQQKIKELMAISRLVVLHPGNTSGLGWEMMTAKQFLAPERLVFTFASWHMLRKSTRQIEYEVFASHLKDTLGISLPEKFNGACFLYFEKDWDPKFAYPPSYTKWFSYGVHKGALRHALEPILKNNVYGPTKHAPNNGMHPTADTKVVM